MSAIKRLRTEQRVRTPEPLCTEREGPGFFKNPWEIRNERLIQILYWTQLGIQKNESTGELTFFRLGKNDCRGNVFVDCMYVTEPGSVCLRLYGTLYRAVPGPFWAVFKKHDFALDNLLLHRVHRLSLSVSEWIYMFYAPDVQHFLSQRPARAAHRVLLNTCRIPLDIVGIVRQYLTFDSRHP